MSKGRTCCHLCMTFRDEGMVLFVKIGDSVVNICLQCKYSIDDAYGREQYASELKKK